MFPIMKENPLGFKIQGMYRGSGQHVCSCDTMGQLKKKFCTEILEE